MAKNKIKIICFLNYIIFKLFIKHMYWTKKNIYLKIYYYYYLIYRLLNVKSWIVFFVKAQKLIFALKLELFKVKESCRMELQDFQKMEKYPYYFNILI